MVFLRIVYFVFLAFLLAVPVGSRAGQMPETSSATTASDSDLSSKIKNQNESDSQEKPPNCQPPDKITNDLGMVFQYISPGSFLMGSGSAEPNRHANEIAHKVTLSNGFYLQNTEVTQGQWKKVMGDNPSEFKECGEDCPVEKVSWNEVRDFIQKLNKKRNSGSYRLPTEAEWEYACKAGKDGPFSFGNCLKTDQANFNGKRPMPGCAEGKYRKTTVPVASFPPNEWGLYDMHGNVAEWCQDFYGKYPSQAVTDPKGPNKGGDYINRGGGWSSQGSNCRCSSRYYNYLEYWDNSVGFRLVYEPSQSNDMQRQ